MGFVGIILGIALGVCLGLFIVVNGVKKSNDLGDSKASFDDFSANGSIMIISSADKIAKNKYEKLVYNNSNVHN